MSDDRSRSDDHDPPVVVAELPWQEAWLLLGRLRSAGIEALLDPPEPLTRMAFGTALEFSEGQVHQVLVYRADLDDARAIAAEQAQAEE